MTRYGEAEEGRETIGGGEETREAVTEERMTEMEQVMKQVGKNETRKEGRGEREKSGYACYV